MAGHLRPDDLIARGNTSDVWRWSPTTVVKVLRPEIPADWAWLEADITRAVYEAGLPAPATEGVVEVEGRPGVVLERVDGASMWNQMKATPGRLPGLIEELVDLQVRIHAAGPIDGLPDLVTRLHGKIDEAEQLPETERGEAHDLLATLPAGTALCHGDMHPANILMSARGWIVVDWFDAAVGYALADLARSSLLMRPPASPTVLESAPRWRHHRCPRPSPRCLPLRPQVARSAGWSRIRPMGGRAGRGAHVGTGPEG